MMRTARMRSTFLSRVTLKWNWAEEDGAASSGDAGWMDGKARFENFRDHLPLSHAPDPS